MIRQSVSSSDISSIGYDESTQTLEIEFQSRGIYQFFGVPSEIYTAIMNSSSCGKYFHSNIKDIYSSKRVSS